MTDIEIVREAIELFAVHYFETIKMKKFIEKNNYDWPMVFGGSDHINPELWHYLNIVAVPKYYTIDRDGTVINVADTLDEEYVLSLK